MKNTYKFTAYAFILITAVLPYYASAYNSKTIEYCERQYKLNTFGPMTNHTRKKCQLLFEKWTYEWQTGKFDF